MNVSEQYILFELYLFPFSSCNKPSSSTGELFTDGFISIRISYFLLIFVGTFHVKHFAVILFVMIGEFIYDKKCYLL